MADGAMDFNSRSTRECAASNIVNAAIDAALSKKRDLQERRPYLGASAVGDSCERRTQFEFAGAPREKAFEPKTLRIFDRGHTFEELARAWLGDAGFMITQRNQRTGQLFAFSQLDGRFKGHVDGVIIEGPEGWKYPALWEHKALGAKGFREISRDGLKKARPGYYAQVQIYMAYLGLTENPAMFSITNADTCEQEHLPVEFDADEAQRMTDRAVRIVKATDAGDLLPRPYKDRSFFECKWCAFAERCWGMAA
jgi:hypothetical protein